MKQKKWNLIWAYFSMALLLAFCSSPAVLYAEEDGEVQEAAEEEEDEDDVFIPDEYYEPVQSNAVEGWPQGIAIQASAGLVMDMDTNAYLYAKNINRQLYPASITKILTCLLVLENCSLDDVITCSEVVYDLEDNASNTGLQPGEQLTVREALYTLMLQSANDTANALAEHVAGSVSAFADMMNQKAEYLGCTGTHFTNPSGLTDDNHYTTAHDMALIAQAAYANPDFRVFVSTVEEQVEPTNMHEETRFLTNHHRMLQPDSDYYQEWCTGGKTGFTSAAWNTLVTFGEKGGRRYVCVLLHGNGAGQNYLETTDLMNYAFDNFEHRYMERDLYGKTLADLMSVHYLGNTAKLQPEELSQKPADLYGGYVTVPAGTDSSLIQRISDYAPQTSETEEDGSAKSASASKPTGTSTYYYNGWKVGDLYVSMHPVNLDFRIPWQVKEDTGSSAEASSENSTEQAKTNEMVWDDISQFVDGIYGKIKVFVDENRNVVILSAGVTAAVLLLLLLILLLRSNSDYRSMKKRRQAEREAERIEAEIEAKTTAEIEQELRAAMEADQNPDRTDPDEEDAGDE